MSKKLYVKNLPFTATEADLKDHFSDCGDVKYTKILKDRETNRSRGCGFIEMGSAEDAKLAITEKSGKDFMGRTLHVEEAREREPGFTSNRAPAPRRESSWEPRPSWDRPLPQPEMTMHSYGQWQDLDRPEKKDNHRKKFDRDRKDRKFNRYEE